MVELCRNQLHVKTEPGKCRECKAACDRRYRATEAGKREHRRAQARYAQTLSGTLNRIEADLRRKRRSHLSQLAGLTGGHLEPA